MALNLLAALTTLALGPIFGLVARLLYPSDAGRRILAHLIPTHLRSARSHHSADNHEEGRIGLGPSTPSTTTADKSNSDSPHGELANNKAAATTATTHTTTLMTATPAMLSTHFAFSTPSSSSSSPFNAGFSSPFSPSPLLNPARAMPPPGTPLKSLVLDLDETLLHSAHASARGPCDMALTVAIENAPITFRVRFRPHVKLFLATVARWYRLVVFTASLPQYGGPLIDTLDGGAGIIAGRYFRDSCKQMGSAFVKDLALVEPDLSRVAIIDNSPGAYLLHPENAIPITTWTEDGADTALLALLPFLDALRSARDVRSLLRLRATLPPHTVAHPVA